MRIALVSHLYLPHRGGIETHVYHLAKQLTARGHEVTVFAQAEGSQECRTAEGFEVRTSRIYVGKDVYPFAPGLWAQLIRQSDRFDVIHAHNYQAVAALAAGFTHSLPFVFTPHYHGTGHTSLARKMHTVYRPFGRAIFSRANQIICVSKAELRLLTHNYPNVSAKAVVIPNGVTRRPSLRPEGWDTREELVVCLGRLEPYKRLDSVIEATAKLPSTVRLLVIGTGSDRARLEGMVAKMHLGNRVDMAGGLSDEQVTSILARARVVVSASKHEAYGLVLLEGRQAGARVVASALPAHREVATLDDASAIDLWDPDTGIDGLSNAIRTALAGSDPGVLAKSVDWADVAAATEDVYTRARASDPNGNSQLAVAGAGPSQ